MTERTSQNKSYWLIANLAWVFVAAVAPLFIASMLLMALVTDWQLIPEWVAFIALVAVAAKR